MKVGTMVVAGNGMAKIRAEVEEVSLVGFESAWLSNIFAVDALTACAVVGSSVEGIELGTAVVPVYSRHPMTMAQQALSVADACSGRFTLGIGLSHQVVIESIMGLDFSKPASFMREYLSVMMPLLEDGRVSYAGERFKVNATLDSAVEKRPQVVIAALGTEMLKIAGSMADGTTTWMTGPATLASHTIPTIKQAAAEAGRPDPRIVVALPVMVTEEPQAALEMADRYFAIYGTLPSYRAMLDREGSSGPSGVAIVGTALEIEERLEHLRTIGVTDFVAAAYGDEDQINTTRSVIVSMSA